MGIIFELLIFSFNYLWDHRYVLACGALLCLTISSISLVFWRTNFFSILILVISGVRFLSLLRIIEGRTEIDYLFRSCRKTTLFLLMYQLIVISLWFGYFYLSRPDTLQATLLYFVVLQLLLAIVLIWSIRRSINKTKLSNIITPLPEFSLPTLSVCIPARNETIDLDECLQSLVANNYPKLEILVLDDCSQTRHTADIIRSFAQEGVRFIKGRQPPRRWLAKNWAYQQLLSEADGEIVLFCGVDIRFGPQTLESLVSTLINKKKTMLSLIPRRAIDNLLPLIQAMRYYWELAPPRRYFNRPPVLSSCWLAYRKALQSAGGFAAIERAIVPEAFFAKTFISNDGYSFLRSNEKLALTSIKSVPDQRSTAIRTRFPQLHKRPELVLLLLLGELWFLFCPFIIFLIGFWYQPFGLIHLFSFITSVLLITSFAMIVKATMPQSWVSSLFYFPLAIATDMGLLIFSMLKYNFSTVEWKSRNVRSSVMRLKTS